MPDPLGRPWPSEYLTGVVMPVGRPKRLLIVDRTDIETRVWPEFNTADLLIGARTPIVYTMGLRHLLRLNEAVAGAVAEIGEAEGGH